MARRGDVMHQASRLCKTGKPRISLKSRSLTWELASGRTRLKPAYAKASAGTRYAKAMLAEALAKASGAGEGNRTLVISLEGCCSTIELHPQTKGRR